MDIPEPIARRWLTEAARHAGLADEEIFATFKSAAQAGTQRREVRTALSFTMFRDIDVSPRKDWLVHEFLGAGELSCLFGQPGRGKSTIAGDLACHVASGIPWFGRRVQLGGVLYVAAERAEVVKRRMAAYRKHHAIDDIALAVVAGPADLRTDDDHANLIIEYAERLAQESNLPTKLIIIETINRVLAGGDENSSVDMGRLINTLALIQHRTNAHILTVHHSPIVGSRLRGHSSLLGACDVTVFVDMPGAVYTARIDKANDGPTGEQIAWTVRSIDLHHDSETGVATTAPVVIPMATPPFQPRQTLTANETTMLGLLTQAGPAGLAKADWYAQARAAGVGPGRPATCSDAKASLHHKGLVIEENGVWRLET